MECVERHPGNSPGCVGDGKNSGERVDKLVRLPGPEFVRTEELKPVPDATVPQNLADGAHAFHVPVEILAEFAETGGPDVVVGKADLHFLRELRSAPKLFQLVLENGVLQRPVIEIGGHW